MFTNLNLFIMNNFQKRNASPLFFQLALVLSLLLVFIALETKTPIYTDTIECHYFSGDFDDDLAIPEYTPEKPKPKQIVQVLPELPPIDKDNLIDNNDENESIFSTTDPDAPIEPSTGFNHNELPPEMDINPIDDNEYNLLTVQEVPVFPGCEGNNEERIKCLSENIGKIIAKNFDGDIAQELGLSPGDKRIFVKFLIDKNGTIQILQTNAPHKALEKEAQRVLGKIPNIIPAKMNGKSVKSTFTQKINYRVMDN